MAALSPVYATRGQLAAYAPASVVVPEEPEATRLLTRASEQISRILFGALYKVDPTGMPTDPGIADAVMRATCAQAVWWLATGDEIGDASQYQSVGIGSITLARGARGQTATPGAINGIAEAAIQTLRTAGLFGNGFTTYY